MKKSFDEIIYHVETDNKIFKNVQSKNTLEDYQKRKEKFTIDWDIVLTVCLIVVYVFFFVLGIIHFVKWFL